MILRNQDGWRRLSNDDPMLMVTHARYGWRKAVVPGVLYVFEIHVPVEDNRTQRRYLLTLNVRGATSGRISIDLPVGRENAVLEMVESLVVALGTVLRLAGRNL